MQPSDPLCLLIVFPTARASCVRVYVVRLLSCYAAATRARQIYQAKGDFERKPPVKADFL